MNEMTPLLAGRWSPRGFDRTHVVGSGQIECMLQAARWAPSAMNRQPWAFVVGRRGDRVHERLEGLARGLSDWALGASALVLAAYRTEGDEPDYALHDLGGAVAHMSVQTEAMGLHVRQFAGYDPYRVRHRPAVDARRHARGGHSGAGDEPGRARAQAHRRAHALAVTGGRTTMTRPAGPGERSPEGPAARTGQMSYWYRL